MQASVKPDDHGVSLKAIRQTKTDDVLIEFKATKEDRRGLGTALAGSFEDDGGVRHLIPRAKLMIYDLVESTEVVDIEKPLKAVLWEHIGAPPRIDLTKKSQKRRSTRLVAIWRMKPS